MRTKLNNNNAVITDLLKTKLFNGEEPEIIGWLIDACQITHCKKNEVLLKPNEENNTLYIVLSGRLRVELEVDGMPTLNYIETHDFVGEMSILEGTTTSASIVADTKCSVFGIKDVNLWSLINRSHVVSRNLLKTLCSRVRNEHSVITENFQLQKSFERQTKIDSLTGLYNRRWLDDALEHCEKRKKLFHLMMLDIDHFKRYNDTQGHLAGDSAIRTVAQTILTQLRPTDHAARYGGEEFMILLPDATSAEANIIAKRVCDAIRKQKIKLNNNTPLPGVTISIGIAEQQLGQAKDSLLAAADAALYRAKNAGRDQISN